jgi:hypothetical protein
MIDVMKQALETFERMNHEDSIFAGEFDREVAALRLAIEQAERQEPVGSFLTHEEAIKFCRRYRPGIEPTEKHIAATIDAYAALFGDLSPASLAAPPQRQPLTDEEIQKLADTHLFYQPEPYEVSGVFNLARAIERAHGIGGGA